MAASRSAAFAELAAEPIIEPAPAPAPAAQRSPLEIPSELVTIATEIGHTWSATYVRTLQLQERDIVGAWPGTLREARRQVLARLPKLEADQLDQLARLTNLAARRGWEMVSEPDMEG